MEEKLAALIMFYVISKVLIDSIYLREDFASDQTLCCLSGFGLIMLPYGSEGKLFLTPWNDLSVTSPYFFIQCFRMLIIDPQPSLSPFLLDYDGEHGLCIHELSMIKQSADDITWHDKFTHSCLLSVE